MKKENWNVPDINHQVDFQSKTLFFNNTFLLQIHDFFYLGNQETRTAGGYSASHTVHEDFVLKIPDGMDLVKTAPILCAGITMYSPLMHWGAGSGEKKTVGIVGIGENMFKIIDMYQ